jgi:hypothetical protein
MQGVRVQVSARQRLLRSETRNLKPGLLKQTPDPRSFRISIFGFRILLR